jgi:Fe-S cluster biogenesis protein NfuA
MIQVTHTEPTPNPNALKFVTDTTLVGEGALSFNSPEEAGRDPFAMQIFALGNIESVYIQHNFVTVSMRRDPDWDKIQAAVQRNLANFTPIDRAPQAAPAAAPDEDGLLSQVNEVIDRFVRPALAGDGGGLEIMGIEGNTVLVRYHGACGSCPSATMGTLVAIENLLRDQIDENLCVQNL